jgi:hypothetical protein
LLILQQNLLKVINGTTGTYDCTGIVSSLSNTLHTVPRYLSYSNPNVGGYVDSVACVPHDDTAANPYAFITSNPINTSEEFAIYKIGGCTNLTSTTCVPVNGIDTAPVGSLEFSSAIYNGTKYPHHDNNDCNNYYNWTWILIFVFVLIFVILLIWFFYWLLMGGGKTQVVVPQTYEVVKPVAQPVAQPQTYVVEQVVQPTRVTQPQTYIIEQPIQVAQPARVPAQSYVVEQPVRGQTYQLVRPVQSYQDMPPQKYQSPVQTYEAIPPARRSTSLSSLRNSTATGNPTSYTGGSYYEVSDSAINRALGPNAILDE